MPVPDSPTPGAERGLLSGDGLRRLVGLVGLERTPSEVTQALHFAVRSLTPSAVGGLLVTCGDEAESACADVFQHGFAQFLLPALKSGKRPAFRVANLGGRYEWGAARIAEEHYAAASGGHGFLALAVKVNAHVGVVEPTAGGKPRRFGKLQRHGADSACCGALLALLEGDRRPFAAELRELFLSEGRDRIAVLADGGQVEPGRRALAAALVSARLQARKAVLDVQDHRPPVPSVHVVLPCVTLNRAGQDTEIVCGLYFIDGRGGGREVVYTGLGDDPAAYTIDERGRRLVVTDPGVGTERLGRDHRSMARQEWQDRAPERPGPLPRDENLDRVRAEVAGNRHHDHRRAKALLRLALPVLAELAPVPAALLLFAEGIAGIHHAFHVHRMAEDGSQAARQVLDDVHARLDELDPDRARALVERLAGEYAARE